MIIFCIFLLIVGVVLIVASDSYSNNESYVKAGAVIIIIACTLIGITSIL